MTPRENMLAALRRKNPEYVPFTLSLCPSLFEEFKRRTGSADPAEYFGFSHRGVGPSASRHPVDYSGYYGKLKEGTTIDEWGVGYEPGSTAHFTRFLHPMEEFDDPDQVWSFPLPDMLADYRWADVPARVKALHDAGYAVQGGAIQIFEFAWYLRGLDNLLCDMLTDEDMARACLKRMADFQVALAAKYAACGVDMILYGDDVGTQRGMMMNVELWRKWLKPDMARAIAAAKAVNPDLIAIYHSDGVIYDIIPELIEIGVDVLNPVQPECMEPALLKKTYGDRLSFWGTIGTQTTMPFGTAEEVERKVRENIEIVGEGGGLCVAPTHLLEPEVPFENIEAMVNAVKKYGRY